MLCPANMLGYLLAILQSLSRCHSESHPFFSRGFCAGRDAVEESLFDFALTVRRAIRVDLCHANVCGVGILLGRCCDLYHNKFLCLRSRIHGSYGRT